MLMSQIATVSCSSAEYLGDRLADALTAAGDDGDRLRPEGDSHPALVDLHDRPPQTVTPGPARWTTGHATIETSRGPLGYGRTTGSALGVSSEVTTPHAPVPAPLAEWYDELRVSNWALGHCPVKPAIAGGLGCRGTVAQRKIGQQHMDAYVVGVAMTPFTSRSQGLVEMTEQVIRETPWPTPEWMPRASVRCSSPTPPPA